MIIDSGVVTGSLISQGSVVVTGSVIATSGFTGSFSGSATSAESASYALTASYVANASSFPFTGSAVITGSAVVTGSLTVTGNIVAQTLVVQTITSSVVEITGSTQFGSTTANTHEFTGSVGITGSLLVNGGALAVQDGTILYHTIAWFTPSSTVSSSGTTVTSVGTQFTSAMIGAKLTISGESRIITAFTSTTQVTVDSAYSQNYSGVAAGSWSVYSISFRTTSGTDRNNFYGTTGTRTIYTDTNNNYQVSAGYALFSALEATSLATKGGTISATSAGSFTFNQGTSYSSIKDLGLRRNNTGSLEIYDGVTAGNYRDLILRNITGSNASFSGSLIVTGSSSFSGSVNITSGSLNVASASLAVSGSLSINGVNITATGGFQQTFSAATTWTATHNLNTLYPVITVYNGSGQVIIPTSITSTSANVTTITFNVAVAGTVNIVSAQLQQNIAVSNPSAVALSVVLGG
jgi:autotransporter-associated beta strand protein